MSDFAAYVLLYLSVGFVVTTLAVAFWTELDEDDALIVTALWPLVVFIPIAAAALVVGEWIRRRLNIRVRP
jgi:uncharacterized membrane protein YGL010W